MMWTDLNNVVAMIGDGSSSLVKIQFRLDRLHQIPPDLWRGRLVFRTELHGDGNVRQFQFLKPAITVQVPIQ